MKVRLQELVVVMSEVRLICVFSVSSCCLAIPCQQIQQFELQSLLIACVESCA
jgi:hypothetical protein